MTDTRRTPEAYEAREVMRNEVAKLREAIKRAGFAVMQTSGDWSIHDVSKLADQEREKTAAIIARDIELEHALDSLVETIETEGLTHSERCDCEFCGAYRKAKRLVGRVDKV
jgi:hypothetical protein